MALEPEYARKISASALAMDFRGTAKMELMPVSKKLGHAVENLAKAVWSKRKGKIASATHELRKTAQKVLRSKSVGTMKGFKSTRPAVRAVTLVVARAKMFRAGLKPR